MRVSAKAPPPRSSTCHGSQWRHDVLTATERAALSPPGPDPGPAPDPSPGPYGIDTIEQSLIDALTPDARLPAATVAAHTGHPESTVRRRLARTSAQHRLVTQVLIDPRAWDCPSRPNSSSAQPPDHSRPLDRHWPTTTPSTARSQPPAPAICTSPRTSPT
ncbi:hypothetical protein [Streptomyces sp. NPDC059928]|uniref:hypothetical protein n=1 Tax=unclassified Streptomyces TaxID=2593676 RepID=UPI00364A45F0